MTLKKDANLEANTMERTASPLPDDDATGDDKAKVEQTTEVEPTTAKPPAYSTSGNTAGRRVGPNSGVAERCVECTAKLCVTGCVGVCCVCLFGQRP
mmetsp:Transcript_18829/g.27847  ORF Transcript_18829/g.27847 Transcript_18829/m.27847 type:complete len:97 (-) Transcript_18829:190-480(-)|eukprot:CAMPEP_0194027130 /NCGR_PEP_ID=MMETSP0009_2-20130614/1343_1 /TAXON_ID=210454 /ORGANISM="Grammatophora oceanica, Strain CCMP 410" /LENGTH=96 /DNA_ID=CAMNT_0038666089 /DNA_START=153 /DNA_END=443 /DNA_ORIENTATION=+